MPDPIKKDPDQIRDYRIPEPLPQTDEPLDINTVSSNKLGIKFEIVEILMIFFLLNKIGINYTETRTNLGQSLVEWPFGGPLSEICLMGPSTFKYGHCY